MKNIYIKSLQIGKVKTQGDKKSINPLQKEFKSAFVKTPTQKTIKANKNGFCGDMVADTKHHGGEEKAIFANSFENYPLWQKYLQKESLPFGALGENLTISGLDETNVCVGDVHVMGTLKLQVSQPRKPCFKISKIWNKKEFTKEIFQSGLTGWYYRVIEEGEAKTGDKVIVAQKNNENLTIMDINKAFASPELFESVIEKIISSRIILESWKKDFLLQTENLYNFDYMEVK